MTASLDAELRRFEDATLRYCASLTAKQFADWRASFDAQTRHDNVKASPAFPSHRGPKQPLDYQLELLERCSQLLDVPGSRGLIGLPTGAGKTFTALRVVFAALAKGYRRILWLAPQRLLIEQAVSELEASWYSTDQPVGLCLYGRDAFTRADDAAGVVRFDTLQMLLRDRSWSSDESCRPDIAIIDEAHHLQENEFGSLAKTLGGLGATVLGLSATPGRESQSEFRSLRELFGGNLVIAESLGMDPVATLHAKGVYAGINYRRLRPAVESIDERTIRRSIRSRGLAGQKLFAMMPGRLDALVQAVSSEGRQLRSLVFAQSIAHGMVICAALCQSAISAELLGSEFGKEHNQAVIGRFRDGHTRCVVNVKYVAVGADFPFAEAAFLSVPIGSPILFEQIVGRIARGPAVGGTRSATLFEFDANMEMLGGIQSYARFRADWR